MFFKAKELIPLIQSLWYGIFWSVEFSIFCCFIWV